MSPSAELSPEDAFQIYMEVTALALNAGGEESDKVYAGPIGAIGGQAIYSIIQLAQRSGINLNESQIEEIAQSGVVERGIVQEAAYQAMCELSDDAKEESGLNNTLIEVALKLYPKLQRINSSLATLAMGVCLEMRLPEKKFPDQEPPRRDLTGLGKPTPSIADPAISPAFVAAFQKPTYDLGAKGSFDQIGPILSAGLCKCEPIDDTFSDPAVVKVIEKLEKAAEYSLLPPTDSMVGTLGRGIMGFAALEALQKIDPSLLEKEQVFDRMKAVIQDIGPSVMNVGYSAVEGLVMSMRIVDEQRAGEAAKG